MSGEEREREVGECLLDYERKDWELVDLQDSERQ